jgi:lysyl-tRNA synthetase class 2
MSRWFQIESLYKFNAKFSPVWEPRFFVYPGGRDAPRIAFAALEAEAFLVWPKLEVKRYARRVARKLGLGKLRRKLRAAAARPTPTPTPTPTPPAPVPAVPPTTVTSPTATPPPPSPPSPPTTPTSVGQG